MTTTNNEQLELGFSGLPPKTISTKREGRIARANWWFAKMREAVADAMDWPAASQPRPVQIWMPGANRAVKI